MLEQLARKMHTPIHRWSSNTQPNDCQSNGHNFQKLFFVRPFEKKRTSDGRTETSLSKLNFERADKKKLSEFNIREKNLSNIYD